MLLGCSIPQPGWSHEASGHLLQIYSSLKLWLPESCDYKGKVTFGISFFSFFFLFILFFLGIKPVTCFFVSVG